MFVVLEKDDFIGMSGLIDAKRVSSLTGVACDAEPPIGGKLLLAEVSSCSVQEDVLIGFVIASALSLAMKTGIGIARLYSSEYAVGSSVIVECIDGQFRKGELASLPTYDSAGDRPRGKLVDILTRT